MSRYISAHSVQQQFDISRQTLKKWATDGRINIIQLPDSKKRLYDIAQLRSMLNPNNTSGDTKAPQQKKKVCYARVSSDKQKEDLQRQVDYLQSKCTDEEIVQDIGSGLNYQRRGFTSLLERVMRGDIEQVTITHKDRLCRYGVEMVELIFKQTNTKLVVLHQTESDVASSRQTELAQDLLAIVNVFVARNNGLRAAENRRKRKRQETEAGQEEEHENNGTEEDCTKC